MGRALNISSRSVTAKRNPRGRVRLSGRRYRASGEARTALRSRGRLKRRDPRKFKRLVRRAGFRVNPGAKAARSLVNAQARAYRGNPKKRHSDPLTFFKDLKKGDVYVDEHGNKRRKVGRNKSLVLTNQPPYYKGEIERVRLRSFVTRTEQGFKFARDNPKRRFKSYGDIKAIVTTLDGKHVADFYTQKEAISFARAYAKKHRIGLRVVDPR